MWLMQALGFLLSALPVADILRNLHSLITPYIQQLEKLADETVSTQIKEKQHKHAEQSQLDCGFIEQAQSLCGITAVGHISAGPDWNRPCTMGK